MLLVESQFPNGPLAARDARRTIASIAEKIPVRVLSDVTLLVSELITNSYRHADRPAGEAIGLRAELKGRTLRVEVTDRGSGRAPAIREGGEDGGWGLRIVERVADRWGTTDLPSGKVVWFEIEAVT